ncbi:RebB family R body protein [Burkholderia sp. 22PA0099]
MRWRAGGGRVTIAARLRSRAIARQRRSTVRPRAKGASMAFPTAVNNQITDAVTQANVKVLGDAPALALDNLSPATSQALSNAIHNATSVPNVNVKVLRDLHGVSLDDLSPGQSQALSNAVHNATTAQQQGNVVAQATTVQGVVTLYALDTASHGVDTRYLLLVHPTHGI